MDQAAPSLPQPECPAEVTDDVVAPAAEGALTHCSVQSFVASSDQAMRLIEAARRIMGREINRQAKSAAALHCRIARAVEELIAAPDVLREHYSKGEVDRVMAANRRAHAILTEDRDPPSQRGAP